MDMSNAKRRLGYLPIIITLAILLAGGLLMCPASAWARDEEALTPALTAGQAKVDAQSKIKTTETTENILWVKAGKQIYNWEFYKKNAKNGSLRPRELPSTYVNGTVSGLSNSNPKTLKVKYVKKYDYLLYTLGKPGKSTTRYTETYDEWENGTKTGYKIKNKVTVNHIVVNYKNPVKVFKVGSVDYAGKFASSAQYDTGRAISGKVEVKAAAGWKLVKIRKVNSTVYATEWVSQSAVKNGGKVSIGKGKGVLEAICYNKAAKCYSSVILMPGGISGFNVVFG